LVPLNGLWEPVFVFGAFLAGALRFPHSGTRLIKTGPDGLPARSVLDFHP